MPEQSAADMAATLEVPPKRERAKPAPIAKQNAPFEIQPITFDVQLEMIDELAREYLPLAILDVANKEEVAAVHEARMRCVKLRTGIDKRRKALKDSAVVYGRTVDSAARALTDALAPIEAHLENEEGKVQREKERLEKEAAEKRQAMIRNRLQLMAQAGRVCVETDVSYLSEEEFQTDLAKAVEAKRVRDEEAAAAAAEQARINEENRIESARIAAERAEMEKQRKEHEAKVAAEQAAEKRRRDAVLFSMQALLEADPLSPMAFDDVAAMSEDQFKAKLIELRARKKTRDDEMAAQKAAREAEQARLDKQRAEQAAAQAKIDAATKAIADAEAATKRAAELEQAKRDAAEQARLDAIADQERKAAESKARAEANEVERKRQEELRPDREKISIFADAVAKLEAPTLSARAKGAAGEIAQALLDASARIRAAAGKLK